MIYDPLKVSLSAYEDEVYALFDQEIKIARRPNFYDSTSVSVVLHCSCRNAKRLEVHSSDSSNLWLSLSASLSNSSQKEELEYERAVKKFDGSLADIWIRVKRGSIPKTSAKKTLV